MGPLTTAKTPLGPKKLAQAWLEIEESAVSWEEPVRGTLVLYCLGQQHVITQPITANLMSYGEELVVIHSSQALHDGRLHLRAGQIARLSFVLPPGPGGPLHSRAEVSVVLKSGLWSQEIKGALHLLPPPSFRVIAKALGHLCLLEVSEWVLTSQRAGADLSPTNPRSMFERMSLNLQRVGEEWYGELKVRVRSGWHLRTEVLNVPLIGGDSAAAQAHFASILRAAGFQVNPEWGLPLPSQPPDPASQALPVPAAPLDRGTDDLPIAQDSDQVPAH